MAIDFNQPCTKVIPPTKLAHIVLRTGKFEQMVSFYKTFLGAEATYVNSFISFLTYDEEHHRIAIISVPGTGLTQRELAGLEHIAFTFDSLETLCLAYRQRKAKVILPIWSVNHGPTTSIYYQDPDGNQIETQVDNFDTVAAADEFMASKGFAENPIGVDFDPEDLIKKLEQEEDQTLLKKRPNIGPRRLDTVSPPPPISV